MVKVLENEALPPQVINRDLIFFDGDCVLCHNLVRFVLKIDTDKHFLLCSLQSETGHLVLERHKIDVSDLNTIYLVKKCGTEQEQVLSLSTAMAYIFSHTRSFAWAGSLLYFIPRFIRDFGYKCVASNRYQIFGKTNEACTVPTAEDRARIIG